MKFVNIAALALIIIGAINWLIIAIFSVNLVYHFLGMSPILEKTVYTLVGLSGLYALSFFKQISKK